MFGAAAPRRKVLLIKTFQNFLSIQLKIRRLEFRTKCFLIGETFHRYEPLLSFKILQNSIIVFISYGYAQLWGHFLLSRTKSTRPTIQSWPAKSWPGTDVWKVHIKGAHVGSNVFWSIGLVTKLFFETISTYLKNCLAKKLHKLQKIDIFVKLQIVC